MMNKYEFYSKLLQEDFPVKYREDFAEHDSEQCKKIANLKAQLAEAVGLLRYSQEIARLFEDEHTAEVGRFLTRHAKEEQQKARSMGYANVTDALKALEPMKATQPAAGEPVASGVNYADEVDLIRAVLEGYSPSIARSDAICSVKLLAAYFAAPPAAAHGVRKVNHDN